MGCRSSKAEEPPLVALCRQRRELIRAVADCRYALAAAHDAYFRALDRVGEALHRFAEQELATAAPASPVITLPPSDGKGKGEANVDRSYGGGNAGEVGASSSSPLSSIYCVHSDDRRLHFPSDSDSDSDSEEGSDEEEVQEVPPESGGGNERLGGRREAKSSSPPPRNPPPFSAIPPPFSGYPLSPPFSNYTIPNYYYMKSSATIPSTIYQEPYTGWSDSGYMGYGYGYSNPMESPPVASVGDESFYRNRAMMSPSEAEAATPPPPPPAVSSWDFFNPFDPYEQFYPEYFKKYGMYSMTSSPNSSEVREREGIPDLEEETEQEIVKEDVEVRNEVDGSSGEKDSGAESLKAATLEQKECEMNDTAAPEVKGSQSNSEVSEVKGASFEEEMSMVTEDSGPGKESAVYAHGTRNVVEAVKEIKEQFRSAASSSEEVSRMLEVGKLRYRLGNRILRVIFSWILDSMAAPVSSSSQSSFKHLQHSAAASRAASENCVDSEAGKLSATLDKLYLWEKKLHREVQLACEIKQQHVSLSEKLNHQNAEEEKLRIIYDRECRRLKALDKSGAESREIDYTQASIRKLLTRINIAIRSVDTISSRIHKLRNEELQPQLIELIQGLVRMWKSILNCHQRQFQAMVESKIQRLMPNTNSQRNSAAKVIKELELELLNWCSCFSNWISTQKAYIESLNRWLMQWLLQETEETPDGVVQFSPSRIGAPAAFIISNDWYHMIEQISEAEVIKAMQSFAVTIHGLWERPEEQQRRKLKTEFLSKDFTRKLRLLQKESRMHGHLDISDKSAVSPSSNDGAFHDDRMMPLDAMKKRLDEGRTKHEQTIKQVQVVAASNLGTSLIPIFEALGNFTSKTLKGYEQVRIPNDSAGA